MKNKIIEKIKVAIKDTSFECNTYVAGGFVRDYIMQGEDFSCNDIDVVVSKNGIDGGIKLAKMLQDKLNASSLVVFKRFGTAKIVIDGVDVEFVATRRESYAIDNRNCEVEVGTLFDDVMRRDFTINSILYDISHDHIIDLANGIDSINNRIIMSTNKIKIIILSFFYEQVLPVFW
ncbi:MAG: hypothetical protein EOM11_10940 [Erysipelotrichia bacterium]|nr:hypothetical protein [Erysipelotrichia bacterium]